MVCRGFYKVCAFIVALLAVNLQANDKKAQQKAEKRISDYKTMVGKRSYDLAPKVLKLVKENHGAPNKELYSAFISSCKTRVFQQLAKSGYKPSSSFLKWANSNQSAVYALYGSVFPADERILINADTLWRKLGSRRFVKYHQLMLGAAVARRSIGVGPSNFPMTKLTTSIGKTVEACGTGGCTEKCLDTLDVKPVGVPSSSEEIATCKAVGEFLRYRKLTPRAAYEKKLHEQIVKIARDNGMTGKLGMANILKMYLVYCKKRPAKRDPFPHVADFFKFLIKNYETTVKQEPGLAGQQWPRFPIDKTPWPLLMPLSKTLPLREAQHIWNRFLGKTKDEKRTQTYGPYRKGEKQVVYTLDPMKWHWNSWPGYAYAGGVCGTMSSIAGGTMTTLGSPMLKAGQPGHSALVGYKYIGDGKYVARVGQSVTAGPTGTGTGWLFLDGDCWASNNWHASADHHYGLALGLSHSYKAWQYGRMNYLIYRALPVEMQQREGYRLLSSTLKSDPFSAQTWYKLAEKAKSFKQIYGLLNLLHKRFGNGGQIETYVMGAADEAIEGAGKEEKLSVQDFVKSSTSFGTMVAQRIVENRLGDPKKFSRKEQVVIKQLLEEKFPKEKEAIDSYNVAIEGQGKILKELMASLQDGFSGKKVKGKVVSSSMKRICNIIEDMDDRKNQVKVGLKAKSIVPVKNRSFMKKGKPQMTGYYKSICETLLKVYRSKPRMKAEEKALKAEMDSFKPNNS